MDNKSDVLKKTQKIENMKCPYCQADTIGKRGTDKDGGTRYVCKSCKKTFRPDKPVRVIVPIDESTTCRRCGGTDFNRGGKTAKGKPLLLCKSCGFRFVPLEYSEKNQPIPNVHCDKCNGVNLARAGYKADGRQMYHCKDCDRHFVVERRIKNYR